jgi:hypothetical protein
MFPAVDINNVCDLESFSSCQETERFRKILLFAIICQCIFVAIAVKKMYNIGNIAEIENMQTKTGI